MAKLEGAQLAERYEGETLPYLFWIERKLDGLRGLATIKGGKVTFQSRNGKAYYNTRFVENELLQLGLDNGVIDGELISEDGTWNTSSSICRSQYVHPEAGSLLYVIFDCVPLEDWNRGYSPFPQGHRRQLLQQRLRILEGAPAYDKFGLLVKDAPHLRLSPIVEVVQKKEDILRVARRLKDEGYEGGMLKDPKAGYHRKRWNAWRKVKFVDTYDCAIINAVEGTGRLVGSLGALLIDADGVETKVGTGFTDSERSELWAMHQDGNLVGKYVEVVAQEVTDDGKYRFPVFVRLRDDK